MLVWQNPRGNIARAIQYQPCLLPGLDTEFSAGPCCSKGRLPKLSLVLLSYKFKPNELYLC